MARCPSCYEVGKGGKDSPWLRTTVPWPLLSCDCSRSEQDSLFLAGGNEYIWMPEGVVLPCPNVLLGFTAFLYL